MPSDPFERDWRGPRGGERAIERPVVSEEDIQEAQAARRSRGLIRSLLRMGSLLAVLGGFAALVLYAYNWGTGEISEGSVPVIQAAATPEKEAPSERGGMAVPYQDSLLLNQSGAGRQVERIVPPPEEPVALPRAEDEPSADTAAGPETAEPEAETAAPVPEPKPDPIGSVIQMAELNGVGSDAKAPADAPSEQPAAQSETSSPGETQVAQVGQVSGFKLQLASLKDEDAARKEWARVKAAHKDLLGGFSEDIQRVDLPEKGVYYRVYAGPLPSRETASDLCAMLKGRDQPCIVIAP